MRQMLATYTRATIEGCGMLPQVEPSAIEAALDRFDRELRNTEAWKGWRENQAHRHAISRNGQLYPVKQIISLASGAPVSAFSGGPEANTYLERRGFTVIELPGRGENRLQAALEKILSIYKERSSQPFGSAENDLRPAFEALQASIQALPAVKASPTLRVTWSIGKGNWARVPWLAVLDSRETNTTQRGVYVVFLFREDMTGVYATFNQGVTEPQRTLGVREGLAQIKRTAADLRPFCANLEPRGFLLDDHIDLRASGDLGRNYEASTVAYKLYERNSVPSDGDFADDLTALIDSYQRYVSSKSGEGTAPGLERLRKRFLARMPDFTNFPGATPDSRYAQEERTYKDELIGRFRERLLPALRLGDEGTSSENVLSGVRELLQGPLSSIGRAQNLISWRAVDWLLGHLKAEQVPQFARLLRHLIIGSGDVGPRLQEFNAGLATLIGPVQPAVSRSLPTFFLMLADPSRYIMLRTRLFEDVAKELSAGALFRRGTLLTSTSSVLSTLTRRPMGSLTRSMTARS
jgi:hypothetical protein